MKKKVAIIGGGYTGLTIAHRLSCEDVDVTVFERAPQVGGLAVGFEIDGIPLEKIYHFLYMTDKDILSLMEELGLKKNLKFFDSSVSTYYGGKLYSFMTPIDLLHFTPLSFLNRIRTGFVALYLQHVKDWDPFTRVTAYDWMKKWAGKQATEIIWKPLLKGKFGKYYNKVAMSWLWSRIRVRVNSKESNVSGEKLGYVLGGFAIITEELSSRIRAKGGKIVTQASIENIIKNGDGTLSVYNNKEEEIFDSVVVTTPTHIFSNLIKDNKEVTDAYRAQLDRIDYIGAIVMVFTSEQEITPYYWHNINDETIPFLVFLSHSALAGRETFQGRNVYYLGVYAPHDHRYFTTSEEEIMNEWEEGLKTMFPHFDVSKIRAKKLFKFQNAQHIVDLEYKEKIPSYESVIPHLYLSNFSQIYPDDRGLNYAVQEGDKIAKKILDQFEKEKIK